MAMRMMIGDEDDDDDFIDGDADDDDDDDDFIDGDCDEDWGVVWYGVIR